VVQFEPKGLIHEHGLRSPLTRLLIFIDESGTTDSSESIFVVASVWCAPDSGSGVQNALKHTSDGVKRRIKELMGSWPKEIHYASGLSRYSYELLQIVEGCSSEDKSILRTNPIWTKQPIRYRINEVNPETEAMILGDNSETSNLMRAHAILSNLRPLITCHGKVSIEVGVIFDSEVWKKPWELLSEQLKEVFKGSLITLSPYYENSSRVPGLQIADMAAGAARHYFVSGDGKDSHDFLIERAICNIGGKATEFTTKIE